MTLSRRRSALGLVLANTFALGSLTTVEAIAAPPPGSSWQLVWNDEFSGSAVDQSRWRYWLAGQTRRAAVNLPSNTFVGNGMLTVRTGITSGQLTAGGLESRIGFGYGYYEVRASVLGGWATFWLQSPGIGGVGNPALFGTEIDVQEACCPGPLQHAVHWDGYDTAHKVSAKAMSPSLVPNQRDFNVYGLEWTPTSYKFWVNGQLSWIFTDAISARNDEWILLTQETNGDFCGGECLYQVDYVRAYRVAPSARVPALPTWGGWGLALAIGFIGFRHRVAARKLTNHWTPT